MKKVLLLSLLLCGVALWAARGMRDRQRTQREVSGIVRLDARVDVDGQTSRIATTGFPLGPVITRDFADVSRFTRLSAVGKALAAANGSHRTLIQDVLYADGNVLAFFGAGTEPFADPGRSEVALSRSVAATLSAERGDTILLSERPCVVASIFPDTLGGHLLIGALLPLEYLRRKDSTVVDDGWFDMDAYTYLQLDAPFRTEDFLRQLDGYYVNASGLKVNLGVRSREELTTEATGLEWELARPLAAAASNLGEDAGAEFSLKSRLRGDVPTILLRNAATLTGPDRTVLNEMTGRLAHAWLGDDPTTPSGSVVISAPGLTPNVAMTRVLKVSPGFLSLTGVVLPAERPDRGCAVTPAVLRQLGLPVDAPPASLFLSATYGEVPLITVLPDNGDLREVYLLGVGTDEHLLVQPETAEEMTVLRKLATDSGLQLIEL